MMKSQDGYRWTSASGWEKGLISEAVIDPPTNIRQDELPIFDVIVVGAGYAGLVAARDATTSSLKTLLLEGRDRIGGRTWSATSQGFAYDMGGTWISKNHTNVWREILQYGMKGSLEVPPESILEQDVLQINSYDSNQRLTPEEQSHAMNSALNKFFDNDGANGKETMPSVPDETEQSDENSLDKISVSDRLEALKGSLTPIEYTILGGVFRMCSGSQLDKSSFYELHRWWALCGHSFEGFIKHLRQYRLAGGQSSLATKIFENSVRTGHLKYSMNAQVLSMVEENGLVSVSTQIGRSYRARNVVCAVPLNLLDTITFLPPFTPGKTAATKIKHHNECLKVHFDVPGRDQLPWSAADYPDNIMNFFITDGYTPSGSADIVAYGRPAKDYPVHQQLNRMLETIYKVKDVVVQQIIYHDWASDPFSKGAWFFPPPNFICRNLVHLQSRHGRVHFANSDWAEKWRGFIDGAMEQGSKAIQNILEDMNPT